MKAIALASWDIFLLRRGPERFSNSWVLMTLLALVYFLTDFPAGLVLDGPVETLVQSAVDLGSWFVFFLVLFASKSMLPKFNHAISAWLGAATIINLLEVPVAFGYSALHGGPWEAYLGIPYLSLAAWSVMIMGYILHRSLETGLMLSLAVAVVCVAANALLLQYLFPVN